MKRINFLVLILSLVIASLLWGYVSLYLNPEDETIVSGIPVRFSNEQVLSRRNLVLVGGRDATVSVKFSGRRQDYAKLDRENLEAVVDLSKIANEGTHSLAYELRGSSVMVELANLTQIKINSTVSVEVDRIIEKSFPIELSLVSELGSNYLAETAVFDPVQIVVKGPSNIINSIEKLLVEYGQSQPITRSVSVQTVYELITKDGTPLTDDDMDMLEFDYDMVWLEIPVKMTKKVALAIDFRDTVGFTSSNILCEIEPKEVMLYGDSDVLDGTNIHYIDTIYLETLAEDQTKVIQISYPNGVTSLDDVTEATATIQIIGVKKQDMYTNNINIKGVEQIPEGYKINVITKGFNVTLRGAEAYVNSVQPHNVRVVADFTDIVITEGTHRRAAVFYVDGFETTVGIVDKGYEVVIEVVPIENGGEDP